MENFFSLFPRYGRFLESFSMLWKIFPHFFHAMEEYLASFPRYGSRRRGTTLWKIPKTKPPNTHSNISEFIKSDKTGGWWWWPPGGTEAPPRQAVPLKKPHSCPSVSVVKPAVLFPTQRAQRAHLQPIQSGVPPRRAGRKPPHSKYIPPLRLGALA